MSKPFTVEVGPVTIDVVRGSVIEQDTDAIVNAASTRLRGGGGVDGAIHAAAGPGLMAELIERYPKGTRTGTVAVTGGHKLKHTYILHTPGPVWHGGHAGEPELLKRSYMSCLDEAERLRLVSIAFCSISTGTYGYPVDSASLIASACAVEFALAQPESLHRIVFAMYGAREFDAFVHAMEHVVNTTDERIRSSNDRN